MTLILILLLGALIGTQVRVFGLIPTTIIAILGSVISDRIHDVSSTFTILTALAVAAALQIGYFIGACIRSVRAGQGSRATAARGWPRGIG